MASRKLALLAAIVIAFSSTLKKAISVTALPFELSEYEEEETSSSSDEAEATSPIDRRKAFRDPAKLWPDAIVPYFVNDTIDRVSKTARQLVKEAIAHWENQTCLRFVPYDPELHKDFITFQKGDWCHSELGHQGGSQPLYLAAPCVKLGTVVHELGHSLGWIHEQMRPDRDDYIDINWKRVQESDKSNFEKYSDTVIDTHDMPYDYGSIMHYSGLTGIIKALDTKKQLLMGQRIKLSFYDVKLANIMYNCAERNGCSEGADTCIGAGYVGPKCACVCPEELPSCSASKKRGW